MMFPEFTPALVQEFPAIESGSRYVQGNQDIKVGENIFRQQLVEVDAPFFEMFTFPMISGDAKTALEDPSSMVLTATVAQRFFDLSKDQVAAALGRRLSITRNEVEYDFTVTGVVEDIPTNSSFQFDAAISFENFGIDDNSVDLMGMEIVEGRNFSKLFPTDSTNSILVNEALVREFDIEDPVGKQLTGWLSFIYDESN